ncbi:MAG: sugar phosphate isomerase/epimerase family protein [Candidatus Hodarchaeota archaeon]
MTTSNISVATYSVRDAIKKKDVGYEGIADFLLENGIKHIELNTRFFKPLSSHPSIVGWAISTFTNLFLVKQYPLDHVLGVIKDKGVSPIMMTIDGANMFQGSEKGREKMLNYIKSWLEPASAEGMEFARIDMGLKPLLVSSDKLLPRFNETFGPILKAAEDLNVKLVIENHYGPSSNVKFLLKVKEEFTSPNCGILLDFGNFKPKSGVYDAILGLKETILICHAKAYEFDESGDETRLDYKRIIENLKSVGFNGYYSIEFEGKGDDLAGTKKTLELLRKYL